MAAADEEKWPIRCVLELRSPGLKVPRFCARGARANAQSWSDARLIALGGRSMSGDRDGQVPPMLRRSPRAGAVHQRLAAALPTQHGSDPEACNCPLLGIASLLHLSPPDVFHLRIQVANAARR